MNQDWDDGQQGEQAPAAPARANSAGAQLQAAREAMGLSVEQLADQLKLSPRQVQSMENDDFANLPPPAVLRGFIRAYAKVVRIDPAPLMQAVPMDQPPVETVANGRSARQLAMPGTRFPSNSRKKTNGPLLAFGVVAVVGVATAAAWQAGWLTAFQAQPPAEQQALPTVQEPAQTVQQTSVPLISVPAPVDPAATGAGAPASMPEMAVDPAVAQPTAAPTPAPTAAPTPAPTAAPTAAPAAAPAAATNTLVVKVDAESWVEVRPVGGAKAYAARLAKAGDTITVEVTGPTQLIVGNPDAVRATLRGSAVSLPPLPGKTVSRVTLK